MVAKTHELRPNQRKAVEALAAGATVENAALAAGVQERTVYNWRRLPKFQQALRDANDAAFHISAQALAGACNDAVQVLRDICNDADVKPGVRVSAARAILDSALRMREIIDLEQRLEALENQLTEAMSVPQHNGHMRHVHS